MKKSISFNTVSCCKRAFTALLILFSSIIMLNAQQPVPLDDVHAGPTDCMDLSSYTYDECILSVKLYIHIIQDDNGNNGFTEGEINELLKDLSGIYNPHKIYFDIAEIEGFPESSYLTSSAEDAVDGLMLIDSIHHSDGIDVFIANSNGSVDFGGMAYDIPAGGCYVIGTLDGLTDHPVIAHEVGHCLGLYHTYHGNPDSNPPSGSEEEDQPILENMEWVQAPDSNCDEAGDCVCGTLRDVLSGAIGHDHLQIYLVDYQNCTFDYLSPDSIAPPPEASYAPMDNVMSAWGICRSNIDPDQAIRIRKTISNNIEDSGAYEADEIIISIDNTWDTDIEICNDVYIKDGATLTITATASIHTNVKFVVEQGGQLVVNGGTMTSINGGKWDGVEVWGTATAPQTPAGQQGTFIMTNGALLENSKNGVRGYNPNPDDGDEAATSGGRIIAFNSTFLNNDRSIDLLPYNQNNLHFIQYTDFEVNEDFNGTVFREHVKLYGVSNIAFNNCTFSNNIVNPSLPKGQGTGIRSLDSRFYVIGINTIFEGLHHGIHAGSVADAKPFTVKDATFEANEKGILVTGINHFDIQDCDFHMGDYDGSGSNNAHDGIQIEACTGFTVQDNTFRGTENNTTSTAGIRVINCGASNDANAIYGNNFDSLYTGNIAERNNASGLEGGGIVYLCNQNLGHNDFDFWVAEDGSITEDQQDAGGRAAGNTFSQNGTSSDDVTDFNNQGLLIDYLFYNDASALDEEPIYYTDQTINLNATTNVNDCLEASNVPPTGQDLSTIRQLFHTYHNQYLTDKGLYDALIDNGNTQSLINQINNATLAQAVSLYNQLTSITPYVSDKALIALIDKAQASGFPTSLMLDILSDNPEAVRKGSIVPYLKANTSLSTAEIDTVAAHSLVHTARDAKEANLSRYYAGYHKQADLMLSYYLKDTTVYELDSIYAWLDNKGSLNAAYLKADILQHQGQSTAATTLLNSIPSTFALTASQQTAHTEKVNLVNLLGAASNGYLELDAAGQQTLANIASSSGIGAVQAANLLDFAYDIPYQASHALPSVVGSRSYEDEISTEGKIQRVWAYPNPAKDELTIRYLLPTSDQRGILSLYDMNGKAVYKKELPEMSGTSQIDISQLPEGLYFYAISIANIKPYTGKFIIQR